jgi:hypothetical protein
MEMKNRLSGDRSVVRENVESFELKTSDHRTADPLCRFHGAAQRLWRNFEKSTAVMPRDDQCMTKMNRPDVKNGNRVAVLVDHFSRCRISNNIAECTIRLKVPGAMIGSASNLLKKL